MQLLDPRDEAKRLGYRVVFVRDAIIHEQVACYNVIYKGKAIAPKVASKLGIPLNEIWVSDAWKRKAKGVLFHELNEISYRYEGYDEAEAHRRAKEADALFEERAQSRTPGKYVPQ